MTIFVCKSCGRGITAEQKPNFCYADRMDTMENVSDEDAKRMGVFFAGGTFTDEGMKFEFPKDVRFHPMTGNALYFSPHGKSSLTDLQNKVMEDVRGLSC